MKFLVIIVASVCANLNYCQAVTVSGNHDQVGRSIYHFLTFQVLTQLNSLTLLLLFFPSFYL